VSGITPYILGPLLTGGRINAHKWIANVQSYPVSKK